MNLCKWKPPCGKCTTCSVLKRTEWANRILIETIYSEYTLFITLTYNDENLPFNNSLTPEHAINFLKKLRYYHEPKKLRYYLCGEYGEQTWRPHYHAILFSATEIDKEHIAKSWTNKLKEPLGFIHFGENANNAVAQYVSGYITKKLNRDDLYKKSILGDRYKEFSLKSQGLGRALVLDIINSTGGLLLDEDVLKSINLDGKKIYLGKYLITKLRKTLLNDTKEPLYTKEMRALRFEKEIEDSVKKKISLSETKKQKILNLETKLKLFKKGKSL